MILSHIKGVYFCYVDGIAGTGNTYAEAIERAMSQLIIKSMYK